MNITVRDEQGIGMLFMMEGVSQEQFLQVKRIIGQQFRWAAQVVFGEVLQRELPDTIMIDLGQNDCKELAKEEGVRMAEFNAELSSGSHLFFSVREFVIRGILEQNGLEEFTVTVCHEMIHAADLAMLAKSYRLLSGLGKEIEEEYMQQNYGDYTNATLLRTLVVFNRYRGEGVAILGSHLLMKREFPTTREMIGAFCVIYLMTMVRAQHRLNGEYEGDDTIDEATIAVAYQVAPAILLLVLDKRGDVRKELSQKAFVGLNTGNFDLTDEEVNEILRASFSLDLSGYIQGLLLLGDAIAPIQPLLEFCARLQRDWDDDNMKEFARLVRQPATVSSFKSVMRKIMGSRMSKEELDHEYETFVGNPVVAADYPQMKEKVIRLYQMQKTDVDPDKRSIAQWALTYLFDEQDVIHDDIVALGFVDDMTVIDYALKMLKDADRK